MAEPNIIDQIFEAFRLYGHQSYGEQVSMQEHMLQAAHFAEQAGAGPSLIAAALLHDYGHLIHDLPEDIADQGIDAIHEQVGADYLADYFSPAVTEPGRLHVAAKRYLCAADPDYFATLTPASVQSLELQGGPFNQAQVEEFERSPYFKEAVQLRRYDEMGKIPNFQTPNLEHFRAYLEAGLK